MEKYKIVLNYSTFCSGMVSLLTVQHDHSQQKGGLVNI